jgi:hypothetical protein
LEPARNGINPMDFIVIGLGSNLSKQGENLLKY